MDYQQPPSHGYSMLPPPPPPPQSVADHHQRPPVPSPQAPPPNPWYPAQFQYQHQHQHHSPSPPPPPQQQQQWGPPPYPAPPHPYPAHHLHHAQYQPPLPPRPPPYHPVNQDWTNANWGHQQTWGVQAHTNGEDWAAKARAWAASKAANDYQQPQSQTQFTPAGRPEEQVYYHDQSTLSASSYSHPPALVTPQHQPPVSHPPDYASFNTVQSSYGNMAGDSAGAFPQHEHSSITHQQEVPSSYSSIAGKEDAGHSGSHYISSAPPVAPAPQHHIQPPLPAAGRSFPMQEPQYTFSGQPAEPAPGLSDQPLEFAPHFNRDYESHVQATYSDSAGTVKGADNLSSMPSSYSWVPPAGSGVGYPSVPQVLPSPLQVDPLVAAPPPIPGHSAAMFGRLPGSSFQQSGSSMGGPYTVSTGVALHPSASFPGDAFGASNVSERPKKPSVPNWLREEIIKKKAVMTSSTVDPSRDGNQIIEDDSIDRSYGKSEPADSKSVDSSRSTEEEDDDEDDVEAARTDALNQEIKRVLTEVLLKVTDELFDEIATKVLNEDDSAEECHDITASNNETSISSRAISTGTVEAKVLIPVKDKEMESKDGNEKSTSSSPGDILGLASYASDDDEDHEIQSTGKPKLELSTNRLESTSSRNISGKNMVESGVSSEGIKEHGDTPAGLKFDHGRKGQDSAKSASESEEGDEPLPSRIMSMAKEEELGETIITSFKESNKTDRHEMRKNASERDYFKDQESHKDTAYEKGAETHRRYDEKHLQKELNGEKNGGKDEAMEKGTKSGNKGKDSSSRRRPSPSDFKQGKRDRERGRERGREKEREREREASVKEGNGRKREKIKDERGEKTQHKDSSDSNRHKRRHRSLSVDSKDSSVFSQANNSNDESSDDSRRKRRSRRHESPSSVRSKRRHVSRSPHSKQSQRRHSPYSSVNKKRGRRSRSRSRSPVRRKR